MTNKVDLKVEVGCVYKPSYDITTLTNTNAEEEYFEYHSNLLNKHSDTIVSIIIKDSTNEKPPILKDLGEFESMVEMFLVGHSNPNFLP